MGARIIPVKSPDGSLSPNAHVGFTTLRLGAGHPTIAQAFSAPIAGLIKGCGELWAPCFPYCRCNLNLT